jgi:hypothetical protein
MDDDFMKELEQLTLSMQKEMENNSKQNETSTVKNSDNSEGNKPKNNSNPFNNFQIPYMSGENEDQYLKELQKLLTTDLQLDANDPETAEMMKLLEDNMKNLQDKIGELNGNDVNSFNSVGDSNNNNQIPTNNNNVTKPKDSNPFTEVFKEMNNSETDNSLFNMLGNLNSGMFGNEEDQVKNVGKLYEVLTKLSNTKDNGNQNGKPEDSKELYGLFEELLEFLLKSEILADPLSQIRASVVTYLEKSKDKLDKEKEEKYKTMLNYIDTILVEIKKPEVNKPLIIDIFYKLNEMSDFDSDIFKDADPSLKEFTNLFKK